MESHSDLAYVLRRDIQLAGHTAIEAVELSGLRKLRRDTFKVNSQVEPSEYETEHMPAFISGQEKISVQKNAQQNSAVPQKVRELRKRLGIFQLPFAEKLGVDQATVSKWEAGKARPTPDAFVRLASLAEGVEKLFFLEHAGLPAEFLDGKSMLPEIQEASHRVVGRALNLDSPEPVWVPLLKDPVSAGNPRAIREKDVLDTIPMTRRLVPRGGQLYAFHVSGDSMAPLVNDGYIVIVDATQRDPKRLVGHMVAAREGDGVTIKWLRKDKDTLLLVPQHISPRIPVRVMRPDDDWDIVGVVVKWIGYPAPPRK